MKSRIKNRIESRTRSARHLLAAATILAGTVGAAPALGEDEALGWRDAPAVAFDVAVLRPASALATVLGVPFFVASVPFVAIEGEILTSLDVFVLAPYEYTVTRPLADF